METTIKISHKFKKGSFGYVKISKREIEHCRACRSKIREKQVVKVQRVRVKEVSFYSQLKKNYAAYCIAVGGKVISPAATEDYLYKTQNEAAKSQRIINVY